MKVISLIFSFFILTNLYAGTEVGNGGEYIIINGVPRLVDLVLKDPSFCESSKVSAIAQQLTPYKESMNKLEKVHWNLAYSIELQTTQLNICFTPFPLVSLKEAGDNIPVKFKQLAIRIKNNIFVNKNIYEKLSAMDKSYLLIHEIMHSYFEAEMKHRKVSIRNMVQAIRLVHLGKISEVELARTIIRSEMIFPEYSKALNTERKKKSAEAFKNISKQNLSYCQRSHYANLIERYEIGLISKDANIIKEWGKFQIEKIISMIKKDQDKKLFGFINKCQWNINEVYYNKRSIQHEGAKERAETESLLITSTRYNASKIFNKLLKRKGIDVNMFLTTFLASNIFSEIAFSSRPEYLLKLINHKNFNPNYELVNYEYHSTGALHKIINIIFGEFPINQDSRKKISQYIKVFEAIINNPKTNLNLKDKLLGRPVIMDIIRFSSYEAHYPHAMKMIGQLLERGANINFIEESRGYRLSAVKYLLPTKESPLTFLIRNNRLEDILYIESLTKFSINLKSDLYAPLHSAAKLAQDENFEILDHILTYTDLERNPTLNKSDETLLMKLIKENYNSQIVKSIFQQSTIDYDQKVCDYYKRKVRCYRYNKWADKYDRVEIYKYLKQID